ncbi:TolB family protein [Lysobacter olei]
MRRNPAFVGSSLLPLLLVGGTAFALSEFGIEGMGVVSTKANEVRATVSPDGQRIVWGSPDRAGGPGGGDLWQATMKDGRWQDPVPLPLNTAQHESAPMFSADGLWLYFASNRAGGRGGDDLYRVPVRGGNYGKPESLGPSVNTAGDEGAPAPSRDGQSLLFASNGQAGARGHDLFNARWDGAAFGKAKPVPGVNTGDDEFDGAWLGDGEAIVFARSNDAATKPIQLQLAQCDGRRYAGIAPLKLSFNTDTGTTRGPMVEWNKPGELLVTSSARAPRAGGLDLYRMKAPAVTGKRGCVD